MAEKVEAQALRGTGDPVGISIAAFFREDARILMIIDAYCVGERPWVCMLDVLGRIVLMEPDGDAFAIAPASPGAEGAFSLMRFDHAYQLLDPDWSELAKETRVAGDVGEACEMLIADARLDEIVGHAASGAALPTVGETVAMDIMGSDVSIEVAEVPARQPHWKDEEVAMIVDQYGEAKWVERDGDRWVTTGKPA